MEQKLLTFADVYHMKLLREEPLSRHTTFQIGGPARFFALPDTAEQVCTLLELCREEDFHYAVIGNGSNLLVPDEGFEGVVIRMPEGELCWQDETTVTAEAGYLLARLSAAAAGKGLQGLTFAQGIPGTVGGGVVMNAGAYGGQIGDSLTESICWTPEGIRRLSLAEHDFSYRHSVFNDHPDWVVLRSVFSLKKGDPETIAAEMADYAHRRREKQPLEWPSAGSTFKRPEGNFAGKLIEDTGLKGLTVGGAQVSEKHAGFVINVGGATCRDVCELMGQVEDRVEARFGVRLEPEVRMLK